MTVVRAALIQASANMPKEEAVEKHVDMIGKAAADGAEVVCLQELFNGPYFAVEQDPKWFDTAEPDTGPTVTKMQEVAREHKVVLVVPFYEAADVDLFYNTAVVIESDGRLIGKYRKAHIPHMAPSFWEKFYFKPGNLGYPVIDSSMGKIGLMICYDRHFPELARALGLKGAEIVFNVNSTGEVSKSMWEIDQRAHAVMNNYFVGSSNRVGVEGPIKFYGSSYFCDPRGEIIAKAGDTDDEIVIADLDLSIPHEIRKTWQFYRDRRPETYGELTQLTP